MTLADANSVFNGSLKVSSTAPGPAEICAPSAGTEATTRECAAANPEPSPEPTSTNRAAPNRRISASRTPEALAIAATAASRGDPDTHADRTGEQAQPAQPTRQGVRRRRLIGR